MWWCDYVTMWLCDYVTMWLCYDDDDDDNDDDDDDDDDDDGDHDHDDCKCGATSGLGRTCIVVPSSCELGTTIFFATTAGQVSECSFILVDDDVQSCHSWTMIWREFWKRPLEGLRPKNIHMTIMTTWSWNSNHSLVKSTCFFLLAENLIFDGSQCR